MGQVWAHFQLYTVDKGKGGMGMGDYRNRTEVGPNK